MLATGAILLATTQFLPQLVQGSFGYTATWAGLVLSPGGFVTLVMMFVTGLLSSRVQPKYLIAIGAAIMRLLDLSLARFDLRLLHSNLRVNILYGGLRGSYLRARLLERDAIVAIVNTRNHASRLHMLVVGDRHNAQQYSSQLLQQQAALKSASVA